MTTTLQNNVALLNARSGIYTAWQIRNFQDGDPPGPGVADYESFRVKQRVAGLAYSVDIGLAGALNQAWIRGTSRDGQGLYRCDNIDYTAPLVNTFLAQFNEAGFAAADPTNPRVDQVFLRVLDQQHDGGASNLLQTTVVTGTPSAPVTLDNRTGVGAVPANSILLADVLIPGAATTIPTVNIRDRRAYPLRGSVPALPRSAGARLVDQVSFEPAPGLAITNNALSLGTGQNNGQTAALMYLPRRIVGATRINWSYIHSGTAGVGSYNIAIFDASGRLIPNAGTAPVAFAGALNTVQQRTDTITATTFEPGYYYIVMGTLCSAGAISYAGVSAIVAPSTNSPAPFPNILLANTPGGTTMPTTILGWASDLNSAGAISSCPNVPQISLSVG